MVPGPVIRRITIWSKPSSPMPYYLPPFSRNATSSGQHVSLMRIQSKLGLEGPVRACGGLEKMANPPYAAKVDLFEHTDSRWPGSTSVEKVILQVDCLPRPP